MALFILLLLCLDLKNAILVAGYEYSSGSFVTNTVHPYYGHQPSFHQERQRRVIDSGSSANEVTHIEGSEAIPLGGAGLTLPDEKDPVVIRSVGSSGLTPFNSFHHGRQPPTLEVSGTRSTCGPVASRRLLEPPRKRPYFAYTQEELDEKVKNDEFTQAMERKKRSAEHHKLSSLRSKRNAAGNGTEGQDTSPLPWTCSTKYEWMDMGVNSYPRFVRTAACTSRLCFNGFFRCKPRRYKTKVLKRITGENEFFDEDVSLPEQLRDSWKFQTITINLCCDCSGRVPTPEV